MTSSSITQFGMMTAGRGPRMVNTNVVLPLGLYLRIVGDCLAVLAEGVPEIAVRLLSDREQLTHIQGIRPARQVTSRGLLKTP